MQTERTRIQSQASHEVAVEANEMGIRTYKKWLCKMFHSRETHIALHERCEYTKDPFHTVWGNDLMYPGDYPAPPEEICNCHCTYVEHVLLDNERIVDGKITMLASGVDGGNSKFVQPYYFGVDTETYPSPVGERTPEDDEVMSGFKYIIGEHTYDEDIRKTNERYHLVESKRGIHLFTENCQNCVTAYECRRRGYDVMASPLKDHGPYYLNNGYIKAFGYKSRNKIYEQLPENAIDNKNIKSTIEREVVEQRGHGSRGIIAYQYKNDKKKNIEGHVFIVENYYGSVHYLDPQTGSLDCEWYFENAYPKSFELYRIDDKPLKKEMREVIMNWYPAKKRKK